MRLVGGGISGHGENVRRTVATRGGHVRHPVIATLVFDLAWLAFSAGSAAQAPARHRHRPDSRHGAAW